METIDFNKLLQNHVNSMVKDAAQLYVVDGDKEILWNLYLDTIPLEFNGIFREKRQHDCSCCRHLIKDFGLTIAIKNGEKITAFGFQSGDPEYQPSLDAMDAYIKSCSIKDVFITKFDSFGTPFTRELDKTTGKLRTWNHLNISIPSKFKNDSSDTIETIKAAARDKRNVFKRTLDEIPPQTVEIILELIDQGSIYRAEERKADLKALLIEQKKYVEIVGEEAKDLHCWEAAATVSTAIAKIRSHAIGTLLINVASGMDLEIALKKYEAIMAPTNYKRPNPIITAKQVEDAQRKIISLGYLESLPRRRAVIDDITINNVLFADRDSVKKMSGDIFADLKKDISVAPKNFDKVEEVHIDKFLSDILPKASKLEILFENRLVPNLVSLIAPVDKSAPSILKWDNGFTWVYKNNVADSLREKVAAAGGRVDGVLRFSHTWNHVGRNASLMDLHVFMPGSTKHEDGKHNDFPKGPRVGWNCRKDSKSCGVQDVDYTAAAPEGYVPVENITFPSMNKLTEGKYVFKIHNWSLRQPTTSGFKAEIEFDGQVFTYEVSRPLANKEWITVAEATLKNGKFTIEHKLSHAAAAIDVWGIKSNQFIPVTVCSYSPNYWDENTGNGNRHYMFMLKDCISDEEPNGFFNEFLKEELMAHKRVFEVLGGKMKVPPSPDQLSGLGFSSTLRNSMVCKVTGSIVRTLKVQF